MVAALENERICAHTLRVEPTCKPGLETGRNMFLVAQLFFF
jgi:hypothetical protein